MIRILMSMKVVGRRARVLVEHTADSVSEVVNILDNHREKMDSKECKLLGITGLGFEMK